ncbi:MAG TPA: hypothetical protein PKD16_02295 [Saprospiraceae bacterium]|jgi:hypothetical protein|nr:hypothetical protein [Saprospiraceae bacterium]
MFQYFMGRQPTLKEQVKIFKTLCMILSGEVILLSALATATSKAQTKQYRLLAQQYDILAEHANWEDPMIKIKMEELRRFREIVDPPKDDE